MRHKYTKELLEPIIKKSMNWSDVCRLLGITTATGAQSHAKKRAKDFGIDFSHFTGQAWRRDKIFGSQYPIEDYLSNRRFISSHRLKQRLFSEGLKEKKCETKGCGITEWMGEEVVFELDHKDNNHFNNNLENLMIVCPNCHGLKTRKARMVKQKTHYA